MDLSDYKTFGFSFWTAVVQLTPKKMEKYSWEQSDMHN